MSPYRHQHCCCDNVAPGCLAISQAGCDDCPDVLLCTINVHMVYAPGIPEWFQECEATHVFVLNRCAGQCLDLWPDACCSWLGVCEPVDPPEDGGDEEYDWSPCDNGSQQCVVLNVCVGCFQETAVSPPYWRLRVAAYALGAHPGSDVGGLPPSGTNCMVSETPGSQTSAIFDLPIKHVDQCPFGTYVGTSCSLACPSPCTQEWEIEIS